VTSSGWLDWLPRERRFEIALGHVARHLDRGEAFQAYRLAVFADELAEGVEHELVRGLVHLSAARHKRRLGDERGAERQLAHARRRLAAHAERLAALGVDPP
jgi:hypothetical protein